MQIELTSKNDKSEKVAYNISGFPLRICDGVLSKFPDYSAIAHWHDDLEFMYILSGSMQYNINGEIITLHENDGIFINARQLHYGFSSTHNECSFICMLLHPILLCASPYIEQNYILPILQNDNLPYLYLHHGKKHEKKILELIQTIYNSSSTPLFALKAPSLFFTVWENLYQLSGNINNASIPYNQHLSLLKSMIDYISNHYSEKITLDDICKYGQVGKTTCCNIFQKYTNKSPISYLTDYRLNKSIDLLLNTDKHISEICFDVGFSGASYFAETFHKSHGCTPTQFRSQQIQ